MPAPWGLLTSGFNVKMLPDILKDMEATETSLISSNLDVQATDPIGVMNGIMAQAIFELWQLAGALYAGMDPDIAANDQLTGLALISGTPRLPASPTTVVGCVVNVNAGFNQAIGTMFASIAGSNNTLQFTNKQAVVSAGGGNVTVDFEAVVAGPTQCLAGTLTVIAQAISGWNTVTNATEGITGTPIEPDALLRARRVVDISAPGTATAQAIQSDVMQTLQYPVTTTETTSCVVIFNDTDVTDSNGLPPHSIEVVAEQQGSTSADDQLLANLIFADKAAGIQTHGTSSKTCTDSQGNTEVIYFSRPVAVRLYCYITVQVSTAYTGGSAQGANTIAAAMATFGLANYTPGATVYAEHLKAEAFVTGVLDILSFTIDTVTPPVATSNIAMTIRQFGSLAAADITVTLAT